MALVIILILYAVAGALLSSIASLEMNPELRLAFNIIGGILGLVGPILVYALIDFRLTKRAVTNIAKTWCAQHGYDFVDAEMHKNHYTAIFAEKERKQRAKFRVRFIPTTWVVKKVEWLKT